MAGKKNLGFRNSILQPRSRTKTQCQVPTEGAVTVLWWLTEAREVVGQ